MNRLDLMSNIIPGWAYPMDHDAVFWCPNTCSYRCSPGEQGRAMDIETIYS